MSRNIETLLKDYFETLLVLPNNMRGEKDGRITELFIELCHKTKHQYANYSKGKRK